MSYKDEYRKWCESPIFDEETKKELKEIENDEKEIEERFYKELEFGTAGLRGIMGAGLNRMNKYTVGKATQGLANFIKKKQKEEKGVAISYDSRNHSQEFAEEAALILNANGIKTYIFRNLAPVPELSFAVRYLKTAAGIMITASHNPAKYNGYKVYGEDGAQVTSPNDREIMNEVKNIIDFSQILKMSKEEAINAELYNVIESEVEDKYIEEMKKQMINPEAIKTQADLSIVYTPLHGAGRTPVQKVLKEIGFNNVHTVKEQEMPDGNFPTVEYPNPEDKKAFKLALELAEKVDAEVVLATDPDADRLGVYVKGNEKEYIPLTGNMSALLILEYILSQRKAKKMLPERPVVVKSIVSSTMAKPIANKYNAELEEVLTGFKYIGEKIKELEKNNEENRFIFGYEESYGCLAGTHARDKDAPVAVMLICEAAAYYKEQGSSLWQHMLKMYEEYGYYKEEIKQVTLEGIDGARRIEQTMKDFRENVPKKIGNNKVEKVRDYEAQTVLDCNTNQLTTINLPKSNVIYYELENDGWVAVRPSGTEPKIKYYMGVKGTSLKDAEEKIEDLKKEI